MSVFDVFTLLGGLAFFLFGMNVMSDGLEKISGGKLEHTLRKMTSNRFKGIGLGAGITVAIQSSSAMTVMLVGLVNSGILVLDQTVGVIMGSNIGTTLTAWILSLTGLEGDNFWLQLLKPSSFSPLFAFLGIVLIMFAKNGKTKDIGGSLVGFGILMFGMELMSGSVKGLAALPEFSAILTAFENPILGLVVGAVFTGIIQSSAATVGIVLAFAAMGNGDFTMAVALPIILGSNIGTCVTALISSIGVNKNAKRVAFIHIIFNTIGSIVWLIVLYGTDLFFHYEFLRSAVTPIGVAIIHTVFNVTTTILLLPFCKHLVKFAKLAIKDKKSDEVYELLDERLMRSPSIAIFESKNVAYKMAGLAKQNLLDSLSLLEKYDAKLAESIAATEEKIDVYEDKLGTYLVKLSGHNLSAQEGNDISKLLHTIGDFERIADHAMNIRDVAVEMHSKKLDFSESAKEDLKTVIEAVKEIMDITVSSFETENSSLAISVEPLEEVIDELVKEVKGRHIERLTQGACTIELGFVHSDLLTNFERISDHCSNVAVAVIKIKDSSFDAHGYLNEIKKGGEPQFVAEFKSYKEKYALK